jgi:hypothetical protein
VDVVFVMIVMGLLPSIYWQMDLVAKFTSPHLKHKEPSFIGMWISKIVNLICIVAHVMFL